MYEERYIRQVRLLLQCLPALRNQDYFALKGGTAINLILRDLPRLSIDIDLTYHLFKDRESSIADIQTGLREISQQIQKIHSDYVIKE
jgi:predicted nucleotidyltransferase component of viral defense system